MAFSAEAYRPAAEESAFGDLYNRIRDGLSMVSAYVRSAFHGRRYETPLKDAQVYCMFLGYPRSGHSLTGSLLDAHPDMVIAHELDALRYIDAGFSRRQILYLLIERSEWFTRKGRKWWDYDYEVPNQWNGRWRSIRVIGDKKGGQSSQRLGHKPELLPRLRETIPLPFRFVHVVRNPFDNIATMHRRTEESLEQATRRYFFLCDAVDAVRCQETPETWLDIRHEAFVANPGQWLERLCEFLGEPAPEDWLKDCRNLVFESPRQSRHTIDWPIELRCQVEDRFRHYPFLEGYTFEDQAG